MPNIPEGENFAPEPPGLPPKAEGWPTAAELRRAAEREEPVQKVLNAHRARIHSPRRGRRFFSPRRP